MLLLEQFEQLTLHPKNAAKLKELVLQLAVQGKLTEAWRNQNPDVEPASELLKRIEAEKEQLFKEKKIKKEKLLAPISEEEVPFDLPDGWEWCRLEEIACKLGAGSTPKGGKEVYVEDGIPFLRSQNVYDNGLRLNGVAYITESVHKRMSGTHVQPKDILLNITGGSIGRCALVSEDFSTANVSQHVAIIRLVNPDTRRYIHYLMTSDLIQRLIMDVQVGVSREGLSMTKLREFLIPLPPLAEQEAIVARVEELMQKIEELEKAAVERIQLQKSLGEAALQKLTTAPPDELEQQWLFLKENFQTIFTQEANVKKLRETILQLAVQGKLTSAWRQQNPTAEPASVLLQKIQAEKAQLVKEKKIKKEKPLEPILEDEVPYELPDGWIWCRLGDAVLTMLGGGTPSKANPEFWDGNIPWASVKDLKGKYLFDTIDKITEKAIHSSSTNLIPKGNVIVCTRMGLGKIVFNEVDTTINQDLKALFLSKYISKEYFYNNYKTLDIKGNGMTVSGIRQEELLNIYFPLPPLAEQEAIVAKVDQLMQLCDELEQQLKQSNQEAEALMQAVVQEALQPLAEGVLEE